MSHKLSRVVGIVTGGAQGLGRAAVNRLVANGAKVTVLDVSPQSLEAIQQLNNPNILAVQCDITNEQQVKEAIAKTQEKFGPKINVAVNCAGIAVATRTLHPKKGPHPLDQFSKVIQVNTIGTFNIIRLVSEVMAKNPVDPDGERGVIVNTASVAAYDGQIGQAAYAASKGAVVAMTLPIARDLSPNAIRVCTIAPGLFLTPMLEGLPEKTRTELASTVPFPKRLGHPDEYAQLVQSIIENPMLNGEVIRLDGALRMQP